MIHIDKLICCPICQNKFFTEIDHFGTIKLIYCSECIVDGFYKKIYFYKSKKSDQLFNYDILVKIKEFNYQLSCHEDNEILLFKNKTDILGLIFGDSIFKSCIDLKWDDLTLGTIIKNIKRIESLIVFK